jgi:hypothetical protein
MELATMTERERYPVHAVVRLRQETSDVINKYAEMLSSPTQKVRPAAAHRMLLDLGCGQVANLLGVKFEAEQPAPPSLSTVRRRKAQGIPVPGALVARARKVARTQAAERRRSA